MEYNYLKIAGFGLIGEDKQKGLYRQVIFTDTKSQYTAELIVFKKERPLLWGDIEKMERGGIGVPYRGYITKFNTIDVVVFGEESIEDAFRRQKWKLKIKTQLSYDEVEKLRKDSQGYITNLTNQGAMEIGWRPIDTKAKLVKFRNYYRMGKFSWSDWYEIVSK